MVSNARVKLSLQVTLCSFMNLFVFLRVMGRDVLLSDIQYGRLHLLELCTVHGYQSCIQTEETEEKTHSL
jgi:hypothetical protein